MKMIRTSPASQTQPPIINFICRKARVTEPYARLVAQLSGLPSDEWRPFATPAPQVMNASSREGGMKKPSQILRLQVAAVKSRHAAACRSLQQSLAGELLCAENKQPRDV